MKANRGARSFARDDDAVFPVVEAILVVILVITAIIFFTSVQRPTTGSEAGGIDLGQVAGDTLRIVALRSFPVSPGATAPYTNGVSPCPASGACSLTLEMWITNLAAGDGASGTGSTATVLDEFLSEVLPTGARYSLRLNNGVTSMQILPQGATEIPQGATASEMMFLPDWDAYKDQATVAIVMPGQLLEASHAAYGWTNPASTIDCIRSPLGAYTRTDGADVGTAGDLWTSVWQPASGNVHRVPSDAHFGTWAGYTTPTCTGSPTQYLRVVRDTGSLRTCTGAMSNKVTDVITTAADCFAASDDEKPIRAYWAGNGTNALPAGTIVKTFTNAQSVTVSDITSNSASGALTLILGTDSPYPPYGLQLVVWFGA